ncbi:MAG: hypothetical protein ACI9DC_001971 [Gammaproteobacteria bacterium]|jgi:hypothetical protein
MPQILLAIAPIFLLIILGHALRRGGIPTVDFWNLNDKLVYQMSSAEVSIHSARRKAPSGKIRERWTGRANSSERNAADGCFSTRPKGAHTAHHCRIAAA